MKLSANSLFSFVCASLVALSSGCSAQTTLKATADQSKAFKVPADFNGYSAQLMRGPSWRDAGFVEKVAGLKPSVIRYPGGTVASYWDWKTGWLMKGITLRRDWAKIPENPLTIKDLKYACDASGAVPILVLNMMNSNLEYQLEFLRAVRQEGMPVKYVELENEIYLGEEFYISKFPTGKDYATEANRWIAAIKKEFPGVKVAVIGCAEKEIQNEDKKKYEQRSNTWNRDLLSVIKNADAITFHIYGGSGLSALNRINGTGESQDKAQAFQAAFDKPGSEVSILGIPFARWATTLSYDYSILPAGMEVWITEYNLFEKEGVVAGTWAHGLYALMQSMLFMESNRTSRICYHNLSTTAQFGAIFNNERGFEKSVRQKPTDLFGYSAAGRTLQLFGQAMDGAASSVPLKIQGVKMQKSFRGLEYPSVYGILTTGKQRQILIMNMSARAETIDLSAIASGNVTWTQITSGIKNQVAVDSDVRKTEGKGSLVKMEAYSVTLVRVAD